VPSSHLISVNPDDPRPLYVQIVDEVRRGILRGALGPDTALPSVRELARDLRVNPNTVQQAYRELEREGEIYIRRGQGSFVAPGARGRGLPERVTRELAEGCLRDAARAGVSAQELVQAILALAEPTPHHPEAAAPQAKGRSPADAPAPPHFSPEHHP
jgi:GntR family transcriptional regulator